MRPIPASRIGESHGLLRAISERGRVRLDEFVTEFPADELFPPELENGLGRTRQFISFARGLGLVKEDRGTVELTDFGKRYVRAADASAPFAVAPAQAEWLRRQLREKHMTDSIFHGLAIGLSLLSSVAPGTPLSTLDFGRSLGYLGRAGWDNENTLQIQGRRYIALLGDLELIDDRRGVTRTGQAVKNELTLPIHMSLLDIAAQLNPGGADAVRTEGEAEWAAAEAPPEAPAAEPEPASQASAPPAAPAEWEPASPAPTPARVEEDDEDEWQDVGPGAGRGTVAAVPDEPPPPPPAPTGPPPPVPTTPPPPAPAPAAATPPTPPAGVWDTAEPDEATSAYAAVRPPAPAQPPPPADLERPQDAPTVSTPPAPQAVPVRQAEAPAPPGRAASGFLDAAAIRSAAEDQGLRLPPGVYAGIAAALAAGKHVVLTGPPGAGKTTLALAVAKAAVTSGRSSGALLVTASHRWSAADTLGRRPRDAGEPSRPGHVIDAAQRAKWLVIDELDRAGMDKALGALSTFLAGLPVTLPTGGEAIPPEGWRIVATAADRLEGGSPALMRRFAQVAVPSPGEEELGRMVDDAAQGDATAAGAARSLLGLREVRALGAGVFLDAARHAAERNAIEPADRRTLAREAYTGYLAPLMGGLDDRAQLRLEELLGGL